MTYEELLTSKSEPSRPLALKIPHTKECLAESRILWHLADQINAQGVLGSEMVKIVDLCNTGEFFDVTRAIKLVAEKSLETYEKQKDCKCVPPTQTLNDPRCVMCGAFMLKDKIGM